jgi:ASC-1-like (ASCH) protein
MLEIQENGVQLIKCPTNLQTAGRDPFEKAVYKEWKEYQQRSKIQTGDKILFKLDKPSLTLTINIIKK